MQHCVWWAVQSLKRNVVRHAEALAESLETPVHVEVGDLVGCLVLTVACVEREAHRQQAVGKPDVPLARQDSQLMQVNINQITFKISMLL